MILKNMQKKLDQSIYDYYASGACDELTLARNRESFKKILLIPRVKPPFLVQRISRNQLPLVSLWR